MDRKQFILTIIKKLLYSNGDPQFIQNIGLYFKNFKNPKKMNKADIEDNQKIQHLPEIIEKVELSFVEGRFVNIRRDCKICKKQTIYCCRDCGDGTKIKNMCVKCFESSHKLIFK